jgi:Uma2 family endonuclease
MRAHPELAVLELDLPDSDGEPMENERERLHIALLLDVLNEYWKGRQDFYTGGNMFLYYSTEQAHQIIGEMAEPTRPRRVFRGPDVFVVLNVDGSFRRQKWVVWEEGGRYPDVIIEFLFPSTASTDQTTKKALYERVFRTPEYYWYDPFEPSVLQGWRLDAAAGYQPMTPDARGWLWSAALQLWLGRWDGIYKRDQATWLRFYTSEGQLLLTADELAETAEQRAKVAEQRADVAEAEVARLRAELARYRGGSRA